MNRNKLLLLTVMFLPWLTVPFLGKKTIKRFSLSAMFICLVVTGESVLANKRRWWRVFERINPNVMGEIPFIAGPFFIGSIWILKLTYGNFLRYFSVNFIVDTLFVYPVIWLQERMGIASLIRLKHYQMLLLFLFKAVLMYGFQAIFGQNQHKKRLKLTKRWVLNIIWIKNTLIKEVNFWLHTFSRCFLFSNFKIRRSFIPY